MTDTIEKLFTLAERLENAWKKWSSGAFTAALARLKEAAEEVGEA